MNDWMKSPPGSCFHAAIAVLVALALALWSARADAEPKKKADPTAAAGKPKSGGEKTYTFGGLDIDGKLKTPQLLYFLNRMKSEFDTTTPDKRSFIPELKRSTDEM
jgi:hypothetical protein